MKNKISKLIEIFGSNRIQLNEELSKYSSFKIGGCADIFFRAKTIGDLVSIVQNAISLNLPYFIIGGATNLLISDKGFRGLVIKNETDRIRFIGAKGGSVKSKKDDLKLKKIYIEVDSGVSVNRLVRYAIDQGLAGLEFFLGQPGSVGGAVYINAHNINKSAFFGNVIVSAKLIDIEGDVKEVSSKYFRFGYDYSTIQNTKESIISVVLELTPGEKEKLWLIAAKTLEYRRISQPFGFFSSGCTFRNIRKSDAVRISTPNYTCSAGFLLDSVGLKGYSIKSVNFSQKHSNFIVHKGGAKASDVLELIKLAKSKVKKAYGIDLKEEIVLLGEF